MILIYRPIVIEVLWQIPLTRSQQYGTFIFLCCKLEKLLNNHRVVQLHSSDHCMILWIGGIKDRVETPSASLLHRLSIKVIAVVLLRSRWLRWFRYLQRATSCIKSVTDLRIPGTGTRGRRILKNGTTKLCEELYQWEWLVWRWPVFCVA